MAYLTKTHFTEKQKCERFRILRPLTLLAQDQKFRICVKGTSTPSRISEKKFSSSRTRFEC